MVPCSYTSDPTRSRSSALKAAFEQLETRYDSLMRIYTRLKRGSVAEASALLELIRREEHVLEDSDVHSMLVLPVGNAISTEYASK
jgi:hypothetical protein